MFQEKQVLLEIVMFKSAKKGYIQCFLSSDLLSSSIYLFVLWIFKFVDYLYHLIMWVNWKELEQGFASQKLCEIK
jgi:hypothetical protein